MPIADDFANRLFPLLPHLVAAYRTPFHIYDELGISSTYRSMAKAFDNEPFRQYFAVKALPNPTVLALLLSEGSGLDCSSSIELALAQHVRATEKDIVFTSNNTTRAEYCLALESGALVTFDDRSLFDKVEALPNIVCFRVSPHGFADVSSLVGNPLHSKFGIPREQLVHAYRDARQRGAARFGIHGMMCANELNLARAVQSAVRVLEIGAQVSADVDIELEYINVGGGLGIPYRPDDRPLDFRAYAKAIVSARRHYFPNTQPRILMECGRYVTGPHGVLVTRVVNRCRKGKDIIGLDASMSALMRPALYHAYHHLSLPFSIGRPEARFDVIGSLCENMDKFAVDRLLADPREGDILLIHDTGAHGHAMGFTYNGRLRPAELLLRSNGEVVEIRRAETFDDYVATVRWKPKVIFEPVSGH